MLYSIDINAVGGYFEFSPAAVAQLQQAGGSAFQHSENGVPLPNGYGYVIIPQSLWNVVIPGHPSGMTWGEVVTMYLGDPFLQTTTGGLHAGALDPGQVQYTTAYDASIVAQAGHAVLTKSMNINTGNKVISQSNLKAQTGLTYIATGDGGNVVGSENLMIDGAGNTTSASDRMLCPFASAGGNIIPAYCNIVQTGNAFDLIVGSVTSTMSERFVSSDATNPVVLDQVFNVKPYSTSGISVPAMGSTSAYIKAHIQEARTLNVVNKSAPNWPPFSSLYPSTPLKAEDLTYSETSSTSGVIQQFTKEIHYQSGKSLL